MVGNQDTDVFILQLPHNLLNIFYCDRVDSGKRFIEHNELRVDGKTTGDFSTTAFTSGQLVTLVLAYLLKAELGNQTFELVFLIIFGLIGHFEYGSDIVFYTHLTEYGGFLCKVSDTCLRPFVYWKLGYLKVVEKDSSFIRSNQSYGHIE